MINITKDIALVCAHCGGRFESGRLAFREISTGKIFHHSGASSWGCIDDYMFSLVGQTPPDYELVAIEGSVEVPSRSPLVEIKPQPKRVNRGVIFLGFLGVFLGYLRIKK